jgi:hypothetical protein
MRGATGCGEEDEDRRVAQRKDDLDARGLMCSGR